jgi:hypothetical protein
MPSPSPTFIDCAADEISYWFFGEDPRRAHRLNEAEERATGRARGPDSSRSLNHSSTVATLSSDAETTVPPAWP